MMGEFKLKDICNLITCGVAKRPDYFGTGIPFLSSRNVKANRIILDEYKFISKEAHLELTKNNKPEKGDILYTRVGSFGEAAINNLDFEFSVFVSLTLIKPKHEIVSNKFLMYFLNSPVTQALAKNSTTGSGVQNLNVNTVREFKINLPPLSDQIRIAEILSQAESLIAQRKQSIGLLDELLKSTFLEMFGDPATNKKKWNKVELKFFGNVTTGNTPSRRNDENYSSNFIEWIKTDNIATHSTYITNALEHLSELGVKNARTVKSGALLVACIAGSIESVGRAALTNRTVSFNQQINAIQPNNDIEPLFLYWLFKVSKPYIQNHASKGMKKMLTKGEFEKIKMIKPHHELQTKFANIVEKVEALKSQYQQSLIELQNMYGLLSQRAFKGGLNYDSYDLCDSKDSKLSKNKKEKI